MERKSNHFSGQLGFVLAAAGSAVGVGNLWRFPYLAAKDGGGLFLIIYFILVLTFGFTLLTSDIAIGRRTQKSAIGAYAEMKPKWKFLGILTFLVPVLIMTYYAVIGGWITKYAVVYLTGQAKAAAADDYFTSFITSSTSPVIFALIFMGVTAFIVYNGVQDGIEKVSKWMMPVLLVLVVIISIYSLTLKHTDSSGQVHTGIQGFLYYLTPNLEGLTVQRFLQILLDAMSQLFFSLSVSMGIMITYGSYVKHRSGISCRCHDHPCCIRIFRNRRNGSRSKPYVCFSPKGLCSHGKSRHICRNPLFRNCYFCNTVILHLCVGIHRCKLYGNLPHRQKKNCFCFICSLSCCFCDHCFGIQHFLCRSGTAQWLYRTAA